MQLTNYTFFNPKNHLYTNPIKGLRGYGLSYRFAFNGIEKDNETYGEGNSYDFGARIYDPRLGRWLSLDPLQAKYPFESHYTMVSNNPIFYLDVEGKFKISPQMAKDYPELANFVKNEVYNYVLNSTELKNSIDQRIGANKQQFDRVFKSSSNSVPISALDFPVGVLGETDGYSMKDGNGVRQTNITLDKSFLNEIENKLKNGTSEEKDAAKLAMATLVVHEGVHALLAETGQTTDINKFDEVGDDIGKQVEKDIFKTTLVPSVPDGGVGDKKSFNKLILDNASKISKDKNVSPSAKPKQKKEADKSKDKANKKTK